MCNGQSHFHINSLHPEGKSSPSSWIKGLLYCIWLPVSLFSYRVLFFLTLSQTGPRPRRHFRTSERSRWTPLSMTSMRRCLLTLGSRYRQEICGTRRQWIKWKLTLFVLCVHRWEGKIWLPLLCCQQKVSIFDKMSFRLSSVQLPCLVHGSSWD